MCVCVVRLAAPWHVDTERTPAEVLAAKEAAFWEEHAQLGLWVIPFGRELSRMPWLLDGQVDTLESPCTQHMACSACVACHVWHGALA